MGDFGSFDEHKALSKSGKNPLLNYPNSADDSLVREFRFSSNHQRGKYYQCNSCSEIKEWNPAETRKVRRLTITDGRITTDPENPRTPHFCQGSWRAKSIVKQLDSENRCAIKTAGKRPRLQNNDTLAEIPVKFQALDQDLRDEIVDEYPNFSKVSRSY